MKARVDIAVSVGFLVFGLFVILNALGFRQGTVTDPIGTSGLPLAAGAVIVALALLLVVRRTVGLVRDGQRVIPHEGASDEPDYPASAWRPLIIWTLAVVYLVVLPHVGFWYATPILVGVLVWLMGVRSWVIVLGAGVGFTAATYGLFEMFLKVNLP